jgi:hypothetical protein
VNRDELLRALRALEVQGVEYALIGATAMGFHGLIRATEAVDLVIRATPDNVARLPRALQAAYPDDPNVEDIRAEDLLGDHPAVRYYPLNGEIFLDILTRLGDAASCETIEAQICEAEGVRVRLITPRALYHIKKESVRPLDQRDAAALRERFQLGDD